MRVLWTEKECAYQGDLVKFPPVRCEPKPVQKPVPADPAGRAGAQGVGAGGADLRRMVPGGGQAGSLQAGRGALHQEAGQRSTDAIPCSLRIEPFAVPATRAFHWTISNATKSAGVDRLILFSQRDAVRMAPGRALEVVRRLASTVERAQHA